MVHDGIECGFVRPGERANEVTYFFFTRLRHQIVGKFIPEAIQYPERLTVLLPDETECLGNIDLLPKAHPIQVQNSLINNSELKDSSYEVFYP